MLVFGQEDKRDDQEDQCVDKDYRSGGSNKDDRPCDREDTSTTGKRRTATVGSRPGQTNPAQERTGWRASAGYHSTLDRLMQRDNCERTIKYSPLPSQR